MQLLLGGVSPTKYLFHLVPSLHIDHSASYSQEILQWLPLEEKRPYSFELQKSRKDAAAGHCSQGLNRDNGILQRDSTVANFLCKVVAPVHADRCQERFGICKETCSNCWKEERNSAILIEDPHQHCNHGEGRRFDLHRAGDQRREGESR